MALQPQNGSRGPVRACVGLGSNVGDGPGHLRAALDGMGRLPGTSLLAAAEPIETEPVGPVKQGPYLNSAAVVNTKLSARELLAGLLAIERSRGRDRAGEVRW